jgi:hypothetical protein
LADPDYEFTLNKGAASRVTLQPRAQPWLIRIAGHDLVVAVGANDRRADLVGGGAGAGTGGGAGASGPTGTPLTDVTAEKQRAGG